MTKLSHAIIFVSDMARSVAFYRDNLGLPVRFESAKWTEFETPGSTLALHLADVPSDAAAISADAIPAGQCHLSFAVEDIDAFHQEMMAKGNHSPTNEHTPWHFDGRSVLLRIARPWFGDRYPHGIRHAGWREDVHLQELFARAAHAELAIFVGLRLYSERLLVAALRPPDYGDFEPSPRHGGLRIGTDHGALHQARG